MKTYYLKAPHNAYVNIDKLPASGYDAVELTADQWTFHLQHPTLPLENVLTMSAPQPGPKTFEQAMAEGLALLDEIGWKAPVREMVKNLYDMNALSQQKRDAWSGNVQATALMFAAGETSPETFSVESHRANLITYANFKLLP